MNELEARLHYPLGDTLPAAGESIEVAPGVRWLRMPLPFALNHINLWLLRDAVERDGQMVDGWTVVDTGIHNPETIALWEQVFATQLDGLPIVRVIVTHMHPDHIGLADWLCQRFQAPLWISAGDYYVARLGVMGPTAFGGERAAAFFAAHGLNSPEAVAQIEARTNYYPSLVPSVPLQYRRLMDGQRIRIGTQTWRCMAGFGHAPEHMALHCEVLNLLLGGDMMLPRISTNVSVFETEPESDALSLFLDSIDRFLPLAENTLTLPSHGKPFVGLHERIRQLHDHHAQRLAEVMEACTGRACSALDVLPVLFPRAMDMHQTTFAMGECVAHLHRLWHQGALHRSRDAQGVYRFSSVR
ncbi:MBL fold metallo-hydrolase [Curvibacter sp. APW13]|uniref:MBL fold metallo-hydrolase n=1 Tax=Curvibacter sp. APW13 TaxID=3077236 RepID=UPI0028DF3CB8|nr:MBL fold metallo-hydrolase [Curvibacter sp. APW13]MDT8989751.1 MBL fold metallo-hydrolase [Curvibacter sp. APW13]